MMRPMPSDVREDNQSLWALTIPPCIWIGYFLASYIATALWCGTAGRDAPLGPVAVGFAAATVVALAAMAVAGRSGWRRYKHPGPLVETAATHDRDTAEDRHRFLGLATVLLAALSAIATVYVALSVILLPNCS